MNFHAYITILLIITASNLSAAANPNPNPNPNPKPKPTLTSPPERNLIIKSALINLLYQKIHHFETVPLKDFLSTPFYNKDKKKELARGYNQLKDLNTRLKVYLPQPDHNLIYDIPPGNSAVSLHVSTNEIVPNLPFRIYALRLHTSGFHLPLRVTPPTRSGNYQMEMSLPARLIVDPWFTILIPLDSTLTTTPVYLSRDFVNYSESLSHLYQTLKKIQPQAHDTLLHKQLLTLDGYADHRPQDLKVNGFDQGKTTIHFTSGHNKWKYKATVTESSINYHWIETPENLAKIIEVAFNNRYLHSSLKTQAFDPPILFLEQKGEKFYFEVLRQNEAPLLATYRKGRIRFSDYQKSKFTNNDRHR